ncbi:PREDICTED: phosphatidylinositol 4-phosphate 5-kinase 6-like [Habropoda laboriosa]|uniref:phosphatidylinositol 4-phosphate 5-kinase 6-like n=1 Tax=Habropoda laboriosa TaxID=597456 RepID=UPI00083DBFD6|nr:PREDICTED: phosphatidylinositol 4-phosphate 5-kinase 6-like [Habropoda laboriosa]
MKKLAAGLATKSNITEILSQNVKTGTEKFTFLNGDVYGGEYKLVYEPFLLVKQGKGTYATDNFDVYHGEWDNDTFATSDIHIKYNNDAQYRGKIDSNGAMNGLGTYIFPDGSSIEADWVDNVPFANIIFREPLGFAWVVQDTTKDVRDIKLKIFKFKNSNLNVKV